MAARKQKPVALPVVTASCKIKIIDDSGTMPVWKTISETLYTPKAIADALRKNKREFAFVFFLGYKEVWEVTGKTGLAIQKR